MRLWLAGALVVALGGLVTGVPGCAGAEDGGPATSFASLGSSDEGTMPDLLDDEADADGTTAVTTESEDDESTDDSEASTTDDPGDSTSTDDSTSSTDDSTSSTDDATDDANDDGMNMGVSCAAPADCSAVPVSHSIRGDQGADTFTVAGHTGRWHRFRVTEADSGLSGKNLKYRATLTVPHAGAFTMTARRAGSLNGSACAASVNKMASGPALMLVLSDEWGEGSIPNGLDDGREIAIEIVPQVPMCFESSTWSLFVEGNKT